MATCSWNSLPTELKLHAIGFLRPESVKTLSAVSCESYALCVPTLFQVCPRLAPPPPVHSSPIYTMQNVTLNSYEALSSFMRHVPKP